MKTHFVDLIAWILIVIGGLNWGLVGLFGFNLVTFLFGIDSVVSRIVFVLVGLAALYNLFAFTHYFIPKATVTEHKTV